MVTDDDLGLTGPLGPSVRLSPYAFRFTVCEYLDQLLLTQRLVAARRGPPDRNFMDIQRRQWALNRVWPQCDCVPLLYVDASDPNWWASLFRPQIEWTLRTACAAHREGGVLCCLGWVWDDEAMGHETLVHLDGPRDRQTLFDPQDNAWIAATFQQRVRLITVGTDVRVVDQRGDDCEGQTLQDLFERAAVRYPDGTNMCAALCMLMIICMRRFGTYDMAGVAGLVRDWVRTRDAADACRGLWVLYDDVLQLASDEARLYRRLGLRVRGGDTEMKRCDALVPGTHGLCGAASVPGWVYCAEHRARLLGWSPQWTFRATWLPPPAALDAAWTPPGPVGRAVLRDWDPWDMTYAHVDRTLLATGLSLLQSALAAPRRLLYVRLTGFLAPGDADDTGVVDPDDDIVPVLVQRVLNRSEYATVVVDLALSAGCAATADTLQRLQGRHSPVRWNWRNTLVLCADAPLLVHVDRRDAWDALAVRAVATPAARQHLFSFRVIIGADGDDDSNDVRLLRTLDPLAVLERHTDTLMHAVYHVHSATADRFWRPTAWLQRLGVALRRVPATTMVSIEIGTSSRHMLRARDNQIVVLPFRPDGA